jgi:hypothetical protein
MTDNALHTHFIHQMSAPPDPDLVADGFVLSVFILLGIVFTVAPLVACYLLSPRCKNQHIGAIYECGMPAFGEATSARFGVFYYLYALIFLPLPHSPYLPAGRRSGLLCH